VRNTKDKYVALRRVLTRRDGIAESLKTGEGEVPHNEDARCVLARKEGGRLVATSPCRRLLTDATDVRNSSRRSNSTS
jgi:hypothetical protein